MQLHKNQQLKRAKVTTQLQIQTHKISKCLRTHSPELNLLPTEKSTYSVEIKLTIDGCYVVNNILYCYYNNTMQISLLENRSGNFRLLDPHMPSSNLKSHLLRAQHTSSFAQLDLYCSLTLCTSLLTAKPD